MFLTPSRFLTMAHMGLCSSGNLVPGDPVTDTMRSLLIPQPAVGTQQYRLLPGDPASFPPGELGDYITTYLSELETQLDRGWPLVEILKNLYTRTFQGTPSDPKQADPMDANARPFLRDSFDGIYTWLLYRSQSAYLRDTPH